MKNFLNYLFIGLIFSFHSSAQEKATVLIAVKAPKTESASLKQYGKIYYRDDYLVIMEIERERVSYFPNSTYQVIDEAGWSGEYFLVSQKKDQLSLAYVPVGRKLYEYQFGAIVKIAKHEEFDLIKAGYHLFKITNIEKPISSAFSYSLPIDISQPDPIIRDIINEVSIDSLTAAVQTLENFKTRFTYSDSIIPAGQWIYDQYRKFGYSEVEFDTFYVNGILHRNIIVTKKGIVYPDSVLIIGGHYDSVTPNSYSNRNSAAPGAEDNGSGTASAIEAARILANHQLEATVKFVAWDAEEIGLRGSNAYAEKAYRQNEPIAFYLNFDMIGYQHPQDPLRDIILYTDEASRPYAKLVADIARTYTSLIPAIPGNSAGSDHWSFQQWGYRAIFGFEGAYDFSHNPNYHRPTDLAENMDFSFYKENVQMGLATILHLAGLADSFENKPFVKYKSHQIDDDLIGSSIGNGNGFLDPGEKIELAIHIFNFGEKQATNVSAALSCNDPFVKIIDSLQNYGTVEANMEKQSQGKFVFQISPTAPSDHTINFAFNIIDDSSNVWNNSLRLKILLPEIVFNRQHTIEVAGNGDSTIDPGETFDILVDLQNIGLRDAADISAVLTTISPEVTIVDSLALFSDIAKLALGNNAQDLFTFEVDATSEKMIIPFSMAITEGGGYYQTTINFYLAIGQSEVLLVEDDGQLDFSRYYTEALNFIGLNYQYWNTAFDGAVPADTLLKYQRVIWYTGNEFQNSLFANGTTNLELYLKNGGRLFINGAVLSLSLMTKPILANYFFARHISHQTNLHHLKAAQPNPICDELTFWLAKDGENSQGLSGEIDAMAPTQILFSYDQHTSEGSGTIKSSGSGALFVEKDNYKAVLFAFAWEGIQDRGIRHQVLNDILNWLQAEATDVYVDISQTTKPKKIALSQNYPNPFNSSTRIRFALPKEESISITVFNMKGEQIRSLVDDQLPAGNHSVFWDGKNQSEVKVASGVYFYRLKAGANFQVRKLLLLK